jgi:hypothetical protein
MKASELVTELNKLIAEHGDLTVYRGDLEGEIEASQITKDCPYGDTKEAFILL